MTELDPSGRVVIDVTQMFHDPMRTGVQRVVRELLRRWPAAAPEPHVVRFEAGRGLLRFPDAAIALLAERGAEARQLPYAELRARLHRFALEPFTDPSPTSSTVLIPEVFYDSERCRFYEDRLKVAPGSVAMLLYDFLPLLQSHAFRFSRTLEFLPYTRLARIAPHVAFISAQTRRDYAFRILHRRGGAPAEMERIGPVLPLGADGLAIERQTWSPRRRLFASIGSIDGRKNQHQIAAAFMRLWAAGDDTPLVMIGHSYSPDSLDWIDAVRRYPQFSWLDSANDEEVAAVLRTARATIYASNLEGYGLPPVESLAAGIPVIASAHLPSLAELPLAGQIRLPEITPQAIADAVSALKPDAVARRIWRGAATLQLQSWDNFASQTAGWCQGFAGKDQARRPPRSRHGHRQGAAA